jgi:hypothetical protein
MPRWLKKAPDGIEQGQLVGVLHVLIRRHVPACYEEDLLILVLDLWVGDPVLPQIFCHLSVIEKKHVDGQYPVVYSLHSLHLVANQQTAQSPLALCLYWD